MSQSSRFNHSFACLRKIANGERHHIFEDQASIGRNEDSVVCVADIQVSRKHCLINRLPESNSFTIQDLSSTGTFLNEKRLIKGKVYPLKHRDKICLSNIELFTYEFLINKKYQSPLEQSEEALNSNFKEKIIDLDSIHCDEMKKLTEQINHFEKERTLLNEELNSRLSAQENYFKQERDSLSNLISSSNEQKFEAEEKIKDMEATFTAEKAILLEENEKKLKEVAEREEQLKKSKTEIEERYQKERIELEERCRVEVEALKEKLVESEQIQDRLKEETLEAEQKLKETKQTLLESELEQFRLHQEKVAVESKLESKIVDLTQESTSKEEMVRLLETRLKEKEKEDEDRKKVMEDLEEEIVCSICTELFIEPIVVNCGHMFCQLCIDEWKSKKKSCPMCRMKIKSCIRIHTMDAVINRSVKLMSAEMQKRRLEIIKERSGGNKGGESAPKRQKTDHNPYVQVHHPSAFHPVLQNNLAMNRLVESAQQIRNRIHGLVADPRLGLNVPRPSTSAEVVANPDSSTPEADPFGWVNLRQHGAPHNRTESPVTVAAIDLTHLGVPPPPPPPRTRRNATATATATSAGNTTIDLTTP